MIDKLELKNFGQHAHLVIDCANAPIVGLMGPNGSGKSTILQALRFAITGYLADNIDTYVKGLDPSTKAEVTMTFSKQGAQGEITRSIGKRSTRKLVWDEKTYTSQDDVNTLMGDIWGVSTKAMLFGVFINQGELDKLLFGTQAEREELFIKLVGLSHCERVCAILNASAAVINTGVVDYDPILKEVGDSLQAFTAKHTALARKYGIFPPVEDGLRLLTKCREARRAWETKQHTLAALNTGLTEVAEWDAQLSSAVAPRGLTPIRSNMESAKAAAQRAKDAAISQISELNSTMSKLATLSLALTEIAQLEKTQVGAEKIANMEAELTDNTARHDSKLRNLEQFRNLVTTAEQFRDLESTIIKDQTGMQRAQEKLASLCSAEELETKRRTWEGLCRQRDLASLSIKLVRARLESQTVSHRCPACGSSDPDPAFCTEENLTQLRASFQELQAEADALLAQIRADEEAPRWAKTIETFQSNIEAARKRQTELGFREAAVALGLPAGVSMQDIITAKSYLETECQQIKTTIKALEQSIAGAKATATKLGVMREQLKAFAGEELSLADIGERMNAVRQVIDLQTLDRQNAEADVAFWTVSLERLTGIETRRASILRDIQTVNDEINLRREDLANATREFQLEWQKMCQYSVDEKKRVFETALEVETMLTAGWVRDPELTYETLSQAETILRDIQVARGALQGNIENEQRNITKVNDRFQELQRAKQESERRVQAVRQLRYLESVFARGGLPIMYTRYKFEQLAALTDFNLQQMNASFSISPDPDVAVSFRFRRINESIELPQDKLSGGQRVVLGLAFLLAVQQLISPQVGLLVLDEPSMHLDESAVEAERELFEGMAARLQNSDTQIWVADHNDALVPAFKKLVRLTAA